MLRSLEGGRSGGGRDESVAEALDDYAKERMPGLERDERTGVERVLDIVAALFESENQDLLPRAEWRAEGPAPGSPAVERAPARLLPWALSVAVRLFPYYCVVSSCLAELFPEECQRMAAWCRGRGLASARDAMLFRESLNSSAASLEAHRELQSELELARLSMGPQLGDGGVQGRFLVAGVQELFVELEVPEPRSRHRARVPPAVLAYFAKGTEVSIVLEQHPRGLVPIASSLPVDSAALGRVLDETRAVAVGARGLRVVADERRGENGAGAPRA